MTHSNKTSNAPSVHTMTQISLGIHPSVWSKRSFSSRYIPKDLKRFHVDSKGSGPIWWRLKLIWVFTGCGSTQYTPYCWFPYGAAPFYSWVFPALYLWSEIERGGLWSMWSTRSIISRHRAQTIICLCLSLTSITIMMFVQRKSLRRCVSCYWRFLAYSDIDLYTVYWGLRHLKWGSSQSKLTCV